jgi:hypothetical protein
MIWDLTSRNSSGVIALTVAWVPTGIKIGVAIVPWGVDMDPKRAAHDESFAISLKVNDCKRYLLSVKFAAPQRVRLSVNK